MVPADIDNDEIGEEYDKWGDDLMSDPEIRFNKLRQFDETLDESRDENLIHIMTSTKEALKCDTIELIVNQIYDRLTISFNNTRRCTYIRTSQKL